MTGILCFINSTSAWNSAILLCWYKCPL